MLDRESYILSELLGPDDPEVKALVWMARDSKMSDAVQRLLRGLCRKRGIDPDDPPAFALPKDLSPTRCPIGFAKCGDLIGDAIGPADADFMGHLGVFGSTGQGKTTLIKLLIERFVIPGERSALVVDPHGEYRDLLVRVPAGACLWLPADELGLNPFEVPRDEDGRLVMTPEQWAGELEEWIRLLWLNDPSCNFFASVVTGVYRERDILGGSEDYPCLSDVIEAVERKQVQRGSDAARAQGKVLDRLTSLRRLLPGLDVRRSRDIHRLLSHCVVLDVSDVKDVGLPALLSLLIAVLSRACRIEPEKPVRRLFVAEEAHLYFGGQLDQRTRDTKESLPTGSLRSLRKAGFCAVLSNQLVSDLARPVLGNLNSVICMRLTRSQCIREAASMLGLEGWQEAKLGSLGPREAIVRLSRYPKPIHMAVPEVDPDVLGLTVSRAEAAEKSRELLRSIPFERRSIPSDSETMGAPAERGANPSEATRSKRCCRTCSELGLAFGRTDHKVMEAICEQPAECIEDRLDRLQMRREKETPARRRLMALGLVRHAGAVGTRRYLFEPTERGGHWARAHGIRVPSYHGDIVHEYCTRMAERKLAQAAPGTSFHRRNTGQPAGVRPDCLASLPGKDGGRVAIQVVVGHKPEEEAARLLKLYGVCKEEGARLGRLELLDLVVCVAINKRVQDSVERAIRSKTGGTLPDGIILLNAEEHLIDPAYDWTLVLDRFL